MGVCILLYGLVLVARGTDRPGGGWIARRALLRRSRAAPDPDVSPSLEEVIANFGRPNSNGATLRAAIGALAEGWSPAAFDRFVKPGLIVPSYRSVANCDRRRTSGARKRNQGRVMNLSLWSLLVFGVVNWKAAVVMLPVRFRAELFRRGQLLHLGGS